MAFSLCLTPLFPRSASSLCFCLLSLTLSLPAFTKYVSDIPPPSQRGVDPAALLEKAAWHPSPLLLLKDSKLVKGWHFWVICELSCDLHLLRVSTASWARPAIQLLQTQGPSWKGPANIIDFSSEGLQVNWENEMSPGGKLPYKGANLGRERTGRWRLGPSANLMS